MPKIFVLGHPGLHGGANTELHHQIILWSKLGLGVNIIPSMDGFMNEPLRQEMLDLGVSYHNKRDYSEVTNDDCVINFCGKEFFEDLDKIREHTKRTIFVNCMTWLFGNEKKLHAENKIAFSLYQRPQVLLDHQKKLEELGSKASFIHFKPYFDASKYTFKPKKDNDKFTIGRISRQDADKFSKETFHIWEYAVSSRYKRGLVLGFNQKSKEKTGNPPPWVETYHDQNALSVEDFYNQCDVIVQSTNTTENWPRIGFEAMYSGCPLVVDHRGGWKYMIDHQKSGFLCKHERDFIYYTSRLGYEPSLVEDIAHKALEKANELADEDSSKESWNKVFEKVWN